MKCNLCDKMCEIISGEKQESCIMRFKTENEFIEEFGPNFIQERFCAWVRSMNYLFGENIKNKFLEIKGPNRILIDRWNISKNLITPISKIYERTYDIKNGKKIEVVKIKEQKFRVIEFEESQSLYKKIDDTPCRIIELDGPFRILELD